MVLRFTNSLKRTRIAGAVLSNLICKVNLVERIGARHSYEISYLTRHVNRVNTQSCTRAYFLTADTRMLGMQEQANEHCNIDS